MKAQEEQLQQLQDAHDQMQKTIRTVQELPFKLRHQVGSQGALALHMSPTHTLALPAPSYTLCSVRRSGATTSDAHSLPSFK